MWGNKAGGWGGLGGIPQRTSVPNSQQVMSDTEFQNDWQGRLPDKYIQENFAAQLIPGASGYSPELAGGWRPELKNSLGGDYGGSAYSHASNAAGNGASHTVMTSMQRANPEYTRMKAEMDAAMQQRTENQTRAQQAYDTGMMGNYGRNGLLPDNYSQAGYGQISGQDQAGAFGADGGTQLGGVDNSFVSGAYTPSNSGAVYNPNPFSAGSFNPTGWGL
jgi:hypothetical protein